MKGKFILYVISIDENNEMHGSEYDGIRYNSLKEAEVALEKIPKDDNCDISIRYVDE